MKIINMYRALNATLGGNLLDNLAAIRSWLGPGTVGRHERGTREHGVRGHVPRHGRGQALTVSEVMRSLMRERLAEALLAA